MSDRWTGEDRYVNCIVTHNVCARDLTHDPAPDTCHHVTTPTGTLLTLTHYLRLSLLIMWATLHIWWCWSTFYIYLRLSRVLGHVTRVTMSPQQLAHTAHSGPYLSQTVTCVMWATLHIWWVIVYFLYLSQTVTCPRSRDTCHHVTTPTGTLLTLVHIYL